MLIWTTFDRPLQWRHTERDCVSNHQPHDCLLNRLFRRRSKKTPKLRIIGLCEGNSPATGEFPAQRASNAENVSIWWRQHAVGIHPMNYVHAWFASYCGSLWWTIDRFDPYPSGLLHWHWSNHTIAPVPVKQSWSIWVNMSQQSPDGNDVTLSKCTANLGASWGKACILPIQFNILFSTKYTNGKHRIGVHITVSCGGQAEKLDLCRPTPGRNVNFSIATFFNMRIMIIWWRHDTVILFASLAICAQNPHITHRWNPHTNVR